MNLAFLDFGRSAPAAPAGAEAELVDQLRQLTVSIPREEWSGAWDAVAALLLTSGSSKVRNAAALALADMSYPRAEEVINSVLARRDVASTAGTLIFALEEVAGRLSFEALLNVLKHGSYEARAEAVLLVEKGRVVDLDEAHRRAMRAELSRLATEGDQDASEAASLALDLLGLNR